MIPGSIATWQTASWQEELQHLIVDPRKLVDLLALDPHWLQPALDAAQHFPLRATPSYVARIKRGDPEDPLLKQILPLGAELAPAAGYQTDPLSERDFNPVPGVVHKYHGRVLLIAATQCAINCRYCFRRHFPYEDNQLNRNQWREALDYIRRHPQINEAILSGGDPLSVSDKQLRWLVESLSQIPHLKRLRIHTRYPVILPSRVTDGLLDLVSSTRLSAVLVVHSNHPQEFDASVTQALRRLASAGVRLLNQTVLLRGINDRWAPLVELSEVLFDAGVMPYYLHLLDQVQGAAHFAVSDEQARRLYSELLAHLPGYLVPKLVRELPFARSKTPLSPATEE